MRPTLRSLLRRSVLRLAGLAAPAILAGAMDAPAPAQVSPNGPELLVNTYTTGSQIRAALAFDSSGGMVVVWQSNGSGGTDTSFASIQAQILDAAGAPVGGQFQVNTYTPSNQVLPVVAVSPGENFLVAWQSLGSAESDTEDSSIQAQLFSAGGEPLGGQFQVNSFTNSHQSAPSVAVGTDGGFVVVWESFGSNGTDTSGWSIQAQRYNAAAGAEGGQIQVNTYTTGFQRNPAIAAESAGDFVVTWESFGSSGTDTSGYSIQARRFASNGTPLGDDFQANSYTTGAQQFPRIAVDALGNFVIAWSSYGSSGSDADFLSIQARLYDSAGTSLGGQFQVNTYTTSYQTDPAVAAEPRGRFVVTWMSGGSSGTDTIGASIQARRFAASGAQLSGEFQVNSYIANQQYRPAIAVSRVGDFVIAWDSIGLVAPDTSESSIRAQRFDAMFRDGFEGGDTSRWSEEVPGP